MRPQVVQQQLRMEDDAILHPAALCKEGAERIAFPVRKMLLPEEGVAEGQPGRDAILLHQRKDLSGVIPAEAGASPAPDAVGRCSVDGANAAPVIEIFPMSPVQGQELPVQLIKLKQTGQVIIGFFLFHRTLFSLVLSYCTMFPPHKKAPGGLVTALRGHLMCVVLWRTRPAFYSISIRFGFSGKAFVC